MTYDQVNKCRKSVQNPAEVTSRRDRSVEHGGVRWSCDSAVRTPLSRGRHDSASRRPWSRREFRGLLVHSTGSRPPMFEETDTVSSVFRSAEPCQQCMLRPSSYAVSPNFNAGVSDFA